MFHDKKHKKKTSVNLDYEHVINVVNLWKTYQIDNIHIHALRGISFHVMKGRVLAIQGASGSGKTTLLNLLAGIDRPNAREDTVLDILGVSLLNRSESWLANFRAKNMGFVLQFFGLLPTLTALENVLLAGYFSGLKKAERHARATALFSSLGLCDRLDHFPSQLSGGEQQRVAIARALIHEPKIVFADEPTGNLDSKTGKQVMSLFLKLAKEREVTVILVTHDPRVALLADHVVYMEDGRITETH